MQTIQSGEDLGTLNQNNIGLNLHCFIDDDLVIAIQFWKAGVISTCLMF